MTTRTVNRSQPEFPHGRVVPVHVAAPVAANLQAQACMACGVRPFALFGSLSEDALASIGYRIDDLRLSPGQLAFHARASSHLVYTVRAGVVRLERVSDAGDRRIVRLAGRGDVIGLEALLGQTYAADAVACTEVQVCVMPRALLEDLSSRNPDFALALMKRWQRALDEADEWLTELTCGPAYQRMLRLLLKLSEHGEEAGSIWLPTRHEMGAMLNITMETASRVVSSVRRAGILIETDGRYARLDAAKLLQALRLGRG